MAISAVKVVWSGLLTNLAKEIRQWKPNKYARELQYRDALKRYLKKAAPDAVIETEYRDQGTTADLFVRWDVLGERTAYIEIKRNLRTKSECDRLVGQIELLKPRKNNIIVVLCGDTSERFLINLQEHYKSYCKDLNETMAIITVGAESTQ